MASAAHRLGTDWLEDVQRDPRTVGAFRRRIEALLRDAAVARRVSRRLGERADDAPVREPVPGPVPGPKPRGARVAPRCDCAAEQPFGGLRGRSGRSIIGLCDCDRPCPLLSPGYVRMGAVPRLAEELRAQ